MASSDKATNDSEAQPLLERTSNSANPIEADSDLVNHNSQLQSGQPRSLATTGPLTGTRQRDQHTMADPSPLTEMGDPKDAIEPFDWEQLEERYLKKISECEEAEQAIYQEFNYWIKVVDIHSTETLHHTANLYPSCLRRGRPPPPYTRTKDLTRDVKVVKAFESALALLGPMS
ncbi:MAG: hypothetical protein Q9187_006188 [Circinaria calcarea]